MTSNNKLKRNDSFVYYEPVTPREMPKQEIAAFCPTTSNIITDGATTQGTQEVSPAQDQAATPLSSVPSTQPATTAAPGVTTAPANNCGQLWHAYGSGCLRLFKDRKDWDAANQHCVTFNTPGGGNGRLISIFSQNDNERIVNLRSSLGFPQGEYYIGSNYLNEPGTNKWADGTAASFTNWNNEHPKGEKVVGMKMKENSSNEKWETRNYNYYRTEMLNFICSAQKDHVPK